MKLISYTYNVENFWKSLVPEFINFTEKDINLCFNSNSTISFFKEIWIRRISKKFFEENPDVSDVFLYKDGKKEWLATKF
jgi:hypothetical protein